MQGHGKVGTIRRLAIHVGPGQCSSKGNSPTHIPDRHVHLQVGDHSDGTNLQPLVQ